MNWNWKQLYENLYRYCWVKTGHAQIAEEITQEAILLFLESHSLSELGRQVPCLYSLARHFCFDFLPGTCGAGSAKDRLEGELESLGPEDRELLFLRYSLGFSRKELSRILEISRIEAYRRERNALWQLEIQDFEAWSRAMKGVCRPPEPRQEAGFLRSIMVQSQSDVKTWTAVGHAE